MAKTRDTSRAAYEHLCNTGQLIAKQARIVGKLLDMPGATSGEVLAALEVRNVNAWRARFTELSSRGIIRESGARRCKVSDRTCITWVPTGRTKPLDVKKGARTLSADARAWRAVAEKLAGELTEFCPNAGPDSALNAYRKLAGID